MIDVNKILRDLIEKIGNKNQIEIIPIIIDSASEYDNCFYNVKDKFKGTMAQKSMAGN